MARHVKPDGTYHGIEDYEELAAQGVSISGLAGNEIVAALAHLFNEYDLPHTLEPGWTTRNPSYNWYSGAPHGVMVHHTATNDYAPERAYPAPQGRRNDGTTNCNLLIQPGGVVNFISTDPANYSSGLNWKGILDDYVAKGVRFNGPQSGDLGPEWYGNRAWVNIEVVNAGNGAPMTTQQERAVIVTCALLAALLHKDSTCVIAHADGRGTKQDPRWAGTYGKPPYSIAGIQDAVQAILDSEKLPEEPDMDYKGIANVPEWGKDAVDWGIENGLINTSDDNADDFDRLTSDGRMWVFMHRFDQYLKAGRAV